MTLALHEPWDSSSCSAASSPAVRPTQTTGPLSEYRRTEGIGRRLLGTERRLNQVPQKRLRDIVLRAQLIRVLLRVLSQRRRVERRRWLLWQHSRWKLESRPTACVSSQGRHERTVNRTPTHGVRRSAELRQLEARLLLSTTTTLERTVNRQCRCDWKRHVLPPRRSRGTSAVADSWRA